MQLAVPSLRKVSELRNFRQSLARNNNELRVGMAAAAAEPPLLSPLAFACSSTAVFQNFCLVLSSLGRGTRGQPHAARSTLALL